MKKTFLLSILILLSTALCSGQSLTAEEANTFKKLALSIDNPLHKELIIKKWESPIFFKVYGSGGALYDQMLGKEMSTTFKQLRKFTGLQIDRTDDDSKVNFAIIIGNPAPFASALPALDMEYFQKRKSGSYHVINNGAIQQWYEVFSIDDLSQRPKLRSMVQIQIIKAMGFWGFINHNPDSVFSDSPNIVTINIKANDEKYISLLYNPDVKAGMNKAALDTVLKKLVAAGI